MRSFHKVEFVMSRGVMADVGVYAWQWNAETETILVIDYTGLGVEKGVVYGEMLEKRAEETDREVRVEEGNAEGVDFRGLRRVW